MHPLCTMAASGHISPVPMSAQLHESDKRSGIYCIWMPSDEKHRVYVGQSINVARRWADHRRELRNGTHHTRPLLNAYNKYGEAAWVWALVEECDATDKVAITAAEQAWMDIVERDRLFNTAPAAGSSLGLRHTPEAVAKVSAARRGRKHSPETIERMRAAHTGKKRSPEANEKTAAANRGRKHSPEAIERMRAAHTGKKRSPEATEKTAAANRGRKLSPEAIAMRTATRAATRAAKLAKV